jgi:hypothetical protein
VQGEHYVSLLASLIILGMIITPALGISVGYSAGDSTGVVSSSASFNLEDSATLHDESVLAGSEIFETRQASGTGHNAISSSVGGNGGSVSNTVDSSGSMSVSAAIAATSKGASIGQSTALSGKSGSVSTEASSKSNKVAVAGGFSGEGNMNSDLSAVSADRAALSGSASIAGVPVLDDGNLQQIASGDMGMSVDGLYAQPSGGLGKFSLNTVNVEKASASGTPSYLTGPVYTTGGGNAKSYVPAGWRWTSASPNIKMVVKSNTIPTGLTAYAVNGATVAATQTWNSATNRKPFASVSTSTTVKTDTYDGNNVVAFKYLSDAPYALAYSRTWYTKVNNCISALESDLSLNTRYRWSTTLPNGRPYYYNDPFDVQSVILHELGHTIGLGDLYNLPSTDSRRSDYKQIMNAYNDVQRTLGNGDKTGAWLLYG